MTAKVSKTEKQKLYARKVRRLLRAAAGNAVRFQDKVDWYSMRLTIVEHPNFFSMTPRRLLEYWKPKMPDLHIQDIYVLRDSVKREPR